MADKFWSLDEVKYNFQELQENNVKPQHRGYLFEKLILSVLQVDKLDPRTSYRPKGEQVDGSFFWQGQTFLFEAKWVGSPVPASDVYAFKGKVDGKFHTTSGIFISFSGFSDDIISVLGHGKELNVLLFDDKDVQLLFEGEISFIELLRFKLRQAGDTGVINARYELKEEAKLIANDKPIRIVEFPLDENSEDEPNERGAHRLIDFLIFVEGQSDIKMAHNLVTLLGVNNLSYKIEVLDGVGRFRQLPALMNEFSIYSNTRGVIAMFDNDVQDQVEGIVEFVEDQLLKASIPFRPLILFIDSTLKNKLLTGRLNPDQISSIKVAQVLREFLTNLMYDDYDPFDLNIEGIVNSYMDDLEWDEDGNTLIGTDADYGHPFTIENSDDLIDQLNEEVGNVANGSWPIDVLKETDFDWQDEIREILIKNYKSKFSKIGWDVDEF
ncbi:restriction endonuclease [Dyadobacter sandarakinus]|uniref:Restriction endonuclease n=1 Tax=Dyadobacter sandarakinus TaxID=2747268 RepID=A0ABX7I7A4_9BACT|nr:restriction endonuclease [Dyadobacter sandarakinus]QRR00861.1 restriction endonuclease [Dyadobacter sandarakinus]